MGRAERRMRERLERLENKKNQIVIDKYELAKIKKDISDRASTFSTEALMSCFALAEHRIHKFGSGRITKTLEYVDELMGAIEDGSKTMDDYFRELEEETGIEVKCVN